MEDIFRQEKLILRLKFNPGLALTDFRVTRPFNILLFHHFRQNIQRTESKGNPTLRITAYTVHWSTAIHSTMNFFVSLPQKRNGIVFSSVVNYLHSDL